jgi:hypothetical protein
MFSISQKNVFITFFSALRALWNILRALCNSLRRQFLSTSLTDMGIKKISKVQIVEEGLVPPIT